MRSRAALLPFPGDPFLLTYWLKFFNEVWGDEVDRLYIHLNSSIEPEVVTYIMALCARADNKIILMYDNIQVDHGPSINAMLENCEETYVILVEDDGFIFRRGVVDNYFSKLERGEYDLIGSPRGSCSMEILSAAENKWGISYEGEGDRGPNFWPNFLFCRADLLKSTDRNFSAKQWKQGEIIAGLEHEVTTEFVNGDTLVNTSLQLRGIVDKERILTIPQYHGHPSDLDHYSLGKYLFDGLAPWTHIGSLSSGVGGVLRDGNNRALARRKLDPAEPSTKLPNYCNTDQEREEWERRVQWWRKFITYFKSNPPRDIVISEGMADFARAYENAVNQIIEQYQLRIPVLDKRDRAYASLGL